MAGRSDVADLTEPKVVVGLDFGTTFSGFSHALYKEKEIFTFYDYPMVRGERPYCKTLTGLYYKPNPSSPGGWQLKSWGYPARAEYEKDFQAVRKLKNAGPSDDALKPVLGIYLTRFKLHLADKSSGPSSAANLPQGLTVDRVITDYLREIGHLILDTLQKHYESRMTKKTIQWCVTVPSIWDNSAKEKMKAFMIGAGLVGGVDGSPYPINVVLEPEAASFHCHKVLKFETPLKVGDKLLVADIGGGTSDIVVQEVVEAGNNYRVKEVTTSSGGLCGGTYVDGYFIEYLHQKIGPCLRTSIQNNPNILPMFIKRWEAIKTSFGEPSLKGEPMDIDLPGKLANDWDAYERRMGYQPRSSYDDLEVTYEELEHIFAPVVEQNLNLIAAQLHQASGVKYLVVVGGFAGSWHLLEKIKKRFSKQVPHIICPPNPGSAICQGAVALALNPDVIVSRISRRSYGIHCWMPFEHGIDPREYLEEVDGEMRCKNRFSIYVKKDTAINVDHCIKMVHKPVYRGQSVMQFELFSSTETEPRYTIGDSVTKEGNLEVDISAGMALEKERKVQLSLYFGRTSIEIKAEALNFSSAGVREMQLPVRWAS